MKTSAAPILLFDGICRFCNQSVQFVIRHDRHGKFKFAALQSSIGQELLKKYTLPTNDFNSLVLVKGNSCYTKSAAVLQICLGLGGLWRILYLLIVIPQPLRDGIYNLVAKNRYKWFGKHDHCMIPTPEVRKRFLS
jgi:predicted DCC family thiol-disulfide oxidoreductase YuxK